MAVRVLVLKATWGPEPFSDAQVQSAVFDQAAQFIRVGSFGQVQITGAQTPWLDAYATPPSCSDALTQLARTAAEKAGYNLDAYSRVVYLVPALPSTCPLGGADIRTGEVLLNGTLTTGLIEHELGHTFGMSHAGAVFYSYKSVPRRAVFDSYGDYWDVMGSGYLGTGDAAGNGAGDGDYGALQKACAGWLTDYTTVAKAGLYTINPLEVASGGAQALVIDTAAHEYWVDHRAPLGNDAYLATAPVFYADITHGIEVHQTERNAVRVYELQRQPDYLLPERNGNFSGAMFTLRNVFALRVVAQRGQAVTVRFRWLDHSPPTRPTILPPLGVSADGLLVRWRPSRDKGSGINHYVIQLDRKPPLAAAADIVQLQMTVPLAAGRHRIRITAVDYAGNRSKTATGVFLRR
jgi:hypothetical protein